MMYKLKNLLFIISYNGYGGIETVTNNLIEKLKKEYNIKIVYIDGENYRLKENEYILKPNLEVKNFILRKIFLIMKVINLFYYKKKNNIDIVFCGGSFCNAFEGILQFFSKNISITSIHSVQSKEALGRKGFYPKLCHFSNKCLLNNFNEVISISKGIKKDLLKTYPNLLLFKNKVIYNGFNFEEIMEKSKEKNEFEKDKYLIFVGRIVEEKQIEIIIKTFYFFHKENQEYKLLLVGSGNSEYEEKLKKIIIKLEIVSSIVFLGKQDNPYKYMKKAKALLLTSKYEGLPSVVIEALILNVPVISTNSSSGIWEILDSEYNLEVEELKKNKIFNNGIITPFILANMDLNLSREEKYFFDALNSISKIKNDFRRENLKKFDINNIVEEYRRMIKNYE